MMNQAKTPKYSPEVRERTVRLVREHRREYPSLWAAVKSIAPKIGCSAHTLLEWIRRDEVDAGTRPGVTSAEAQRIKELEREVKELRRPTTFSSWPVRFSPRRWAFLWLAMSA